MPTETEPPPDFQARARRILKGHERRPEWQRQIEEKQDQAEMFEGPEKLRTETGR